jgi:transposase
LQAAGHEVKRAPRSVRRLIDLTVSKPDGLDARLYQALSLCQRMDEALTLERQRVEAELLGRAKNIEAISRLKTIPSVGDWVAVMLYAWVGQVERFGSARELASYVGLVPTVRQSGDSSRHGGITKLGSPQLRSALVQAAHVLMFRCRTPEALPLQAIATRIHKARARRKIAVVAAARHILRIAYYILRDGSVYDPTRLSHSADKQATEASAA